MRMHSSKEPYLRHLAVSTTSDSSGGVRMHLLQSHKLAQLRAWIQQAASDVCTGLDATQVWGKTICKKCPDAESP